MYVCLSFRFSQYIYFPFKSNVYIMSNRTQQRPSIQNYTAQTTLRCSNLAMLMSLSETICLSVCQRTFTGNVNANTEKDTYNTKSLR